MKKAIFSFIIIATALCLNAQQPTIRDYTMKLDSVIGSNNFDMNQWKEVFTFGDNLSVVTTYTLENNNWVPSAKTEKRVNLMDGALDCTIKYQWVNNDWEPTSIDSITYIFQGGERLESTATYLVWSDGAWEYQYLDVYEYDDQNRLINSSEYEPGNNPGDWDLFYKTTVDYNEYGNPVRELTSVAFWGNNLIDYAMDSLLYDEDQQCISFRIYYRAFWGGGGWSLSEIYDNTFENGRIKTTTLYDCENSAEPQLNDFSEFFYDEQGNLVKKTVKVYNGDEWIDRDVFENTFDHTIDASSIRGLDAFWGTMVSKGMYNMVTSTPIFNQWLSCSMSSTNYDTRFTVYCSSLDAVVDENHEDGFKVYDKNGCLIVENVEPTDLTVYDLLGRVVATRTQVQRCSIELRPGSYLVSKGNKVIKAVVR